MESMRGVQEPWYSDRGILRERYANNFPGDVVGRCKCIMVRPSISRGRGYAVVLERDENDDIRIQPAPRTARLARRGRFDAFPTTHTIDNIPDTILANIFSYIDEPRVLLDCGLVSKRWRRIIDTTYVKTSPSPLHPAVAKLRAESSSRKSSKSESKQKNKDQQQQIVRVRHPPRVQALETTKLKIFLLPSTTTNGGGDGSGTVEIETCSQRKEDKSYREVSIKVKMGIDGDSERVLLDYWSRLANFLLPIQGCLLVDVELTDSLLKYLLTVWQPKLHELRLLRCAFDRISPTGLEILRMASKMRQLFIDDCPITSECVLADFDVLTQMCKGMPRLELCFRHIDEMAAIIDDRFLDTLTDGWSVRSDVRWLKLKAPAITADGIEKMVGRYFKLRYGAKFAEAAEKNQLFLKVPKLVLWICDSTVDVDDLLQRRTGKKWFREEKMHTLKRRKLYDAYGKGEDFVIWFEKS